MNFKAFYILTVAVILVGQAVHSQETSAPKPEFRAVPAEREVAKKGYFHENRMDWSIENAQLFKINSGPDYHLSPVMLTHRWQLDDVGNDGWLRGNTEWATSAYVAPVIAGPESYFAGALFGPRYNFVQEGWNIVPYLDAKVGFLFTDSRGLAVKGSQGQDFAFTFTVGSGFRYIYDESWSFSIGVLYQHISNAGLSEPSVTNNGIDSIGPNISLNFSF